ASVRPIGKSPVFPAHDGALWAPDDWRNWRRRVWHGEPERPRRDRKHATPFASGLRTSGDAAAGPPLELCDAPRLRGDPAHADRQGSRDERADDRAALRRRDRELGRPAGPGG